MVSAGGITCALCSPIGPVAASCAAPYPSLTVIARTRDAQQPPRLAEPNGLNPRRTDDPKLHDCRTNPPRAAGLAPHPQQRAHGPCDPNDPSSYGPARCSASGRPAAATDSYDPMDHTIRPARCSEPHRDRTNPGRAAGPPGSPSRTDPTLVARTTPSCTIAERTRRARQALRPVRSNEPTTVRSQRPKLIPARPVQRVGASGHGHGFL
jgi:hypothetical protein